MPDYRVTVTLRVHDDNPDNARGKVQVMLFQLARAGQSNLFQDVRGYDVHSDVWGEQP